ncbi:MULTISPECIES: sulfonate ABC transporter substrate-binding protein [Acinetobacter]|uniref:sulfonate ABC transporter substrate-binding protein n=1 Tax=Acinetobacter TaxID=469 RepID=UPI002575F554|nr:MULTISPECIES: sulfonate ABC transporter substrate-binding protein [Acinetobacter]MDM1765808.1 sulfonate ABC transporter substrate-binding protein [Acinetobacter sp. 226-1]MDM1769550.1 sulfonate ABC transporter substrate-binding protein [Acinetobacter sp. 226-4]MDQ9023215.1 sulfonate ABC transporter substrate-binding protein [Acinetobacter sichuanensis]
MTRSFQPTWKKITILSASLVTVMMLSACSKKTESTTLNIGYQKYGLLPIIKARGDLDKALKQKGINIKWVEFPAGPQLLEGLNVGSVVFGEAGEAPPIFAQAANSKLVYIANQPAAPKAEALIVPKDSNIRSIQELKGKRVVLNKGSNVHYLLLKLLEANHLKLSDIDVVYLPPADARAAFEKGAVDAWVIWDPFFAAAEQQLGAKVLATGENLVSNHQFYLADREFAEQHPDVLKTVVNELNTTTQWVSQHQTDAAKLLEQQTGLSTEILSTSISRMGFGVKPISNEVAKEQQYVADAFYQQKLIPNKINIQAAILAH